jgi:MFS family permease
MPPWEENLQCRFRILSQYAKRSGNTMKDRLAGAAWAAWLLAAIYYFYQYALRSAPAVMLPQLSEAFQITPVAVASLAGIFYYGYSPFSLIAGAAIDRLGAKGVASVGALLVGIGALLFGTGSLGAANLGRFLQGAGGVFALVAAVYIATKSFPASYAATLIGATQMFGMAGGWAGQFVVGPMIVRGVPWSTFWIGMGLLGVLIAVALFLLLPRHRTDHQRANWISGTIKGFGVVFRNPQSILCGIIAGLLFIPTTIFDMVWGVRYLQEAHGFEYADAVIRSSSVPLGWIVGCPLLGFLSDRIGQRRPVIIGGGCVLLASLAWILYGSPDAFPPYVLGFVAGVASGAAMLTYTVIKESNPPELSGTATGVINFLNFTFSALIGPAFGWIMQAVSGGGSTPLESYQRTFGSMLYGVGLAIVLSFILKETGTTKRVTVPQREAA